MEILGILAALGAALCWGTYIVPFKKYPTSNLVQFQAIMAVGILISGLIVSLIGGYPLSLDKYGIISGVMWASANVVSLIAVLNLGLTRAVPVMTSLVVLGSFLWGALVFNELPRGIFLGFLGIGSIIFGVILVSTIGNTQSENVKKGLMAAILAGLIWGSQFAPLKIGNIAGRESIFPISLGVFMTGALIFLLSGIRFNKEGIRGGILSGVIWSIGNLLALTSVSMIGLAKGVPISQSAVLVAVLWGLFYFKEITLPRHRMQVLIGALILLAGVIILGLA